MNDDTLAKRLADSRKARGLTQEQAAREIGITCGTLCRWESGRRSPRSMATLAAVRRWLATGEAGR